MQFLELGWSRCNWINWLLSLKKEKTKKKIKFQFKFKIFSLLIIIKLVSLVLDYG